MPGVAIVLKDLLRHLDAVDVPHAYETDIRRKLRRTFHFCVL